nr:ATPase, T2SS/T4P/T4SS family [Nocardioides perillae]
MIGEIRDHETASIAVEASLTGHLGTRRGVRARVGGRRRLRGLTWRPGGGGAGGCRRHRARGRWRRAHPLAGIAIPLFLNQRQKAADAATKSDLKNAATVLETYFVDNQTYTGVVSDDLAESNDDITLTLAVASDGATYCITGVNSQGSKDFKYDANGGGLAEGTCTGYTPPTP